MEHHVRLIDRCACFLRQRNLGFTLGPKTDLSHQTTIVLDLVVAPVIDDDVVGEVAVLAGRAQPDHHPGSRQRRQHGIETPPRAEIHQDIHCLGTHGTDGAPDLTHRQLHDRVGSRHHPGETCVVRRDEQDDSGRGVRLTEIS